MSNHNSIRAALENKITNNWTATPIHYDNVIIDTVSTQPYLLVNYIPMSSSNAVLGRGRIRHYGEFDIRIFIPANTGTGLAYEYADQIKNIFSNQTFDGVNCYSSEVIRHGIYNSTWFVLSVNTPFWADEEF